MSRRSAGPWALAALAATFAACASTGSSRRSTADLTRARAAVEDAREAGAPTRATEAFSRAEVKLQEAEVAAGIRGQERPAQVAADLAEAEARGAAAMARAAVRAAQQRASASADLERLNARLRTVEEEQRRQEDRIAILIRDLELTETELIRTKARLQGNESKAEASAAIAEARILVSRLANTSGRTAAVIRAEESLAKAEEQLQSSNFGAAIFFALKAQDTVKKAQGGADDSPLALPTPAPPPAPKAVASGVPAKASYVASVDLNIRRGPANSEPVLRTVRAGAVLAASATARGGWVQVTYEGVTGWSHSSLLR